MHNILIVVPDMTRKAHLKTILPKVLKKAGPGKINPALPATKKLFGERKGWVKIIVATGLHKPHTKAELRDLVGTKIFSDYAVVSHNQNKSNLINKGKTKEGIPIVLNRNLEFADEIITVGLIEPHLYAGYSGGAKTIAIGLAGEETINATHHPRFLDKAGTSIGSIRGNPFQNCLWEIIEGLPVKYSVNVVNNRNGSLKRVFRGDVKNSFSKGVKFARKIFENKMDKKFDAVICEVNPPKDANLYQASRAFNYVLNTPSPIVKRGGIVLVCASLKDGFGCGIAERRFARTLKTARSPQEFIGIVKSKGCIAGEHRAYMVARALTKARLGFIGSRAAIYTKGLPFLSFPTVKAAVKFIKGAKGKTAKIYVIKHALSVIPSKQGKA